ncbi:hypothetical protein ACFVS9_14330 [Streptomyces sp. NPDC058008]|uniref:hypothetical protein n=1 Tax=Streptomyces sp. NPDC058008 TaxID=3346303 RepID=UPI0036E5D5FE
MASQVNLLNVAVTRAKSQLITVGSRAFWQGQAGLPSLLAGRSELLGAGSSADRPGTAFGARPRSGFREELTDRLQDYLRRRGVTDLERDAVVGGHAVDLLFAVDGANTAVLIDTGPEHELDPARHLRLTHACGDLLPGLPSGEAGAKSGPVTRTVRVPAWRILAGESTLEPLFA